MYGLDYTRSNITHEIEVFSRYILKPGKRHSITTKEGFKGFVCIYNYGMCYQGILRLVRVLDIHGPIAVDKDGDLDHKR